MRLSFGVVIVLVTLGHPPRRSSASLFFFILPLGMDVKYVLIYIYIYIYVGIFIKVVKNLCCYTPEPRGPNHSELASWALGWTWSAFPTVGVPRRPSLRRSPLGTASYPSCQALCHGWSWSLEGAACAACCCFEALFGIVSGDIRCCHLVASQGHLPACPCGVE
jgi:hypothetical protein